MPSSKNKKIAFIENDRFLSLAYKYELEKGGYEVFLVSETEPGFIEEVVKFEPSVIILDLIIQPMDGFEILENLKKNSKLEKTPTIVFSNLQQDSDIKKCLDLGAHDYMTKTSTDIKQFMEKIKSYFDEQ